jgi:uncharacterized coiled-coil DUF342 family protein
MENTNKKIDELTALVKGNASSIDELAMLVKSGFDHMGDEISSVRTELKAEISSVRTELKNEISSEISSVRTEISALRSEMHNGFMKTNDKVDLLAEKLVNKNVITKTDAKEVMSVSPFPLS